MSFPHRESTSVRLGPVEAYAALHLRTMVVLNSAVILSLHSADRSRAPEALLSLREGDQISTPQLEFALPGISSVQWRFLECIEDDGYRLSAITDDVVVTLSMKRGHIESRFLGKGRLRGTAARLIVTIENGHRGRTSLSADDCVATGEGED